MVGLPGSSPPAACSAMRLGLGALARRSLRSGLRGSGLVREYGSSLLPQGLAAEAGERCFALGQRLLILVLLAALSGCVALEGDGRPVLELSEGAQPLYPPAAKEAGIEGDVTLIYTVTASGQVENVRVLAADPAEVFDDAALAAVRTWRYRPLRQGGEPVVLENVLSTLRFRLEEAYPGL